MSAAITVTFSSNFGAGAGLDEWRPKFLAAAVKAIDLQNELTLSTTAEKRLSFSRDKPPTMEGLRMQTGRLRQSFQKGKAIQDAAKAEGETIVSAIGSNVQYAAVHEFGFAGSVPVPPHFRLAFGAPIEVKGHMRKVNLPARRMVQRTLEERKPKYVEALDKAALDSWATVGGNSTTPETGGTK